MSFEWDEDKRQVNIEKHGIDFSVASDVFDGRPVVTLPSPREGEDRWATIGEVNGRLVLVAWAARGNKRRIISARKLGVKDERKYRELLR